jgi:mannan endo-1,4-beta-mannosidase
MRHQRCLQHASVLAATAAAVLGVTLTACTASGGPASLGTASPASPRPAAPASAPLELGVFEPGEWASYQPVARFAAETGHRPSIVLIYSGWPEPFQARFAAMVHAHHAEPFVQMEPVGASLAAIAAGKCDRYLETYADQVRTFGHPVILSFAAEMNGSWYAWGYGRAPARLFVAAWRHVVDVFRAQGARNVTWLWTVNTVTEPSAPLRQWWPGAGYVDWVGIDGYFFRAADTYGSVFGATITQVRALTGDPVLLAETAVGPVVGVGKIAELFAGARADHLAGLVWFDQDQHDGLNTRTGAWPTAPRGWRRSATPVKPFYPNVPWFPSRPLTRPAWPAARVPARLLGRRAYAA